MCFIRTAQALRFQLGNPTRKLALIALADLSHPETGECYPSYDYIADVANASRRSVMRHIDELEKQGYITVIRRKDDNKKNKSNLYKLNFDGVNLSPPSDKCDKFSGDTVSPDPTTLDPNTNPINSVDSAFDIFWSGWHKKLNKVGAKKSFKAVVKRLKIKNVERFAKHLVADCEYRLQIQQKGFDAMHPTTYLNNERWTDERTGIQTNEQQSQANGATYGEHADQSQFPEHIRIKPNDLPAIKQMYTAYQREFIESQSNQSVGVVDQDVRENLEFNERRNAE